MNKIKQYWQTFCLDAGLENIQYKEAFQFGEKADLLADLVIEGKKTATCSGFLFYELEKDPLPVEGQYSIVLNGRNEPVAVIQTHHVEIHAFKNVPEEFALKEGEGNYAEWKEAHIGFFTKECAHYGTPYSEDMLLVCEQFKKVYPK